MKAFAWRTGLIQFGRTCPFGACLIAEGAAKRLRDIVEVNARHTYGNPTQLLVPGIPEAESDVAALEALRAFQRLVRHRLAGGTGWPVTAAGGSAA